MLQAILLLNPPKLDLNQTMNITQWDIKKLFLQNDKND